MRAAIYARISSDPSGRALGVARQLEDCRKIVEEQGWSLVREYVDNDVSAHSGKVRPEYQELLLDMKDGLLDAVVVWKADRLHRSNLELELFLNAYAAAGMQSFRTVQGMVDPSSPDGLMMLRFLATIGAMESDIKSERVRRKMQQNAEAGLPHGGPRRPFGYEDDKVTIRSEEAEVVRDLAARLLAGESLVSLARTLQDGEVATVNGGMWRPSTVRSVLYSARISGQRDHKGKIIGPAVWDEIITPEQTAQIRALLDDPKRKTARSARRYLLAGGLLRCHRCDTVMVSNPRDGVRRYICKNDANITGCGRTYVDALRVEELIYEAVLMRLETPELADALAGRQSASAETFELSEAVQADTAKLEELASMWADGVIDRDEWMAARTPLEARRTRNRRTLQRASQTTAIDGLVGDGSKLRSRWDALSLNRQRRIIQTVLDHAVIGPGPSGKARFTPERVRPVWRL